MLEEQRGQDRVLYLREKIRGPILDFYELPEGVSKLDFYTDTKLWDGNREGRKEVRTVVNSVKEQKDQSDLILAYQRLMVQMLLIEGFCKNDEGFGKERDKEAFARLQDELWANRDLMQNVLRYWFDEKRLSEFITELWEPGDLESPYEPEFQKPSLRLISALRSLEWSGYLDPSIERQRVAVIKQLDKFIDLLGTRDFHRPRFGEVEGTLYEVPPWLKEGIKLMLSDEKGRRSDSWVYFKIESPITADVVMGPVQVMQYLPSLRLPEDENELEKAIQILVQKKKYLRKVKNGYVFTKRGIEYLEYEVNYNLPFTALDLAQAHRNDGKKVDFEFIGNFLKDKGLPEDQYKQGKRKWGPSVQTKLEHVLSTMVQKDYLKRSEEGYAITDKGIVLHEYAKQHILRNLTGEMEMDNMRFRSRGRSQDRGQRIDAAKRRRRPVK